MTRWIRPARPYWLGEELMRVAESLARSARRRSFDAEVLEASIRMLNVTTDASLAVLDGQRRDPALPHWLEEATTALWFDPSLVPDQDAVYRLTQGLAAAVLYALGDRKSVVDDDLRVRIRQAHEDVMTSAYKRRRELA